MIEAAIDLPTLLAELLAKFSGLFDELFAFLAATALILKRIADQPTVIADRLEGDFHTALWHVWGAVALLVAAFLFGMVYHAHAGRAN